MKRDRAAMLFAGAMIAIAGYMVVTSGQQRAMPVAGEQALFAAMATSNAYQVETGRLILTALVPRTPEPTASKTPKRATRTPLPTYQAGYATPGVKYIVPEQIPEPDIVITETPVWCPSVVPDDYGDTPCEVE